MKFLRFPRSSYKTVYTRSYSLETKLFLGLKLLIGYYSDPYTRLLIIYLLVIEICSLFCVTMDEGHLSSSFYCTIGVDSYSSDEKK